jgi:hypothetical protein
VVSGYLLIPEIAFVEFDLVLVKEFAEFVLEGLFLVVAFLFVDVLAEGFEVARANREGGVAILPSEVP